MLLGAGFSAPFGMPLVVELNQIAEAIPTPEVPTAVGSEGSRVSAARLLHRALRSEYGAQINFELALHAIESLLSYSAADTFDDRLADVHQVMRAFTDPSPRWTTLVHYDVLKRLRESMLTEIVRLFNARERKAWTALTPTSSIANRSSQFIDALSQAFSLRCFTLNYDTLIDRHLNWNDGFPNENGAAFSRSRFNKKLSVSEPFLFHLHGSTQFGFTETGAIGKFRDSADALASYEQARSFKPNQAGELNDAGPIISGLRKLDKLNSTPYGYYYSAFINSIIAEPRLLVIGYGFKDAHLNYWLGQHRAIHRSERRVVLIRKSRDLARAIGTANADNEEPGKLYRSAAEELLWRQAEAKSVEWKSSTRLSYMQSAQLLVVLSGYPLNGLGLRLVRDHLAS